MKIHQFLTLLYIKWNWFHILSVEILTGWETFLSYDSQVALSSSTCSYLPVLFKCHS